MTRIALAEHGSLLGTRWLGDKVRALIAAAVAEGPVDVDFAGVDLASESFMDEAFGKLTGEVSPSVLNERCRIVNANPTILTMLRVAIWERRRMRDLGGRPPAIATFR